MQCALLSVQTPLHVSSEHGCASNVQALLEHAAHMTAKDSNGMTALDLAEAGDHTLTLNQLKEAAGESHSIDTLLTSCLPLFPIGNHYHCFCFSAVTVGSMICDM